MITNNQVSDNEYFERCSINKCTCLIVNGIRYVMTRVEGIKVAPAKTFFSYVGQDLTFTLYFPPIPASTTSMDLIESEDSDWKFYGIKIK